MTHLGAMVIKTGFMIWEFYLCPILGNIDLISEHPVKGLKSNQSLSLTSSSNYFASKQALVNPVCFFAVQKRSNAENIVAIGL